MVTNLQYIAQNFTMFMEVQFADDKEIIVASTQKALQTKMNLRLNDMAKTHDMKMNANDTILKSM